MKSCVSDCLPGTASVEKFARVVIDPFGKPVQMLLREFIKTAYLRQETAYESVSVFVAATFKRGKRVGIIDPGSRLGTAAGAFQGWQLRIQGWQLRNSGPLSQVIVLKTSRNCFVPY